MAKFYGQIGYAITEETRPGIWEERVTERNYYGDITRNTHRFQGAETLNDDINVSNEISIISDSFANEYFYAMRYVTFMGSKWKITNVEVNYPRLTLIIGGVYTEESN